MLLKLCASMQEYYKLIAIDDVYACVCCTRAVVSISREKKKGREREANKKKKRTQMPFWWLLVLLLLFFYMSNNFDVGPKSIVCMFVCFFFFVSCC